MIDPKYWPATLRDLAQIVGDALAETLPEDARQHAPQLAEAVVARVVSRWGGALVYVPKGLYGQVASRAEEIARRRAGGERIRAIALSLGLTDSQVRKLAARHRAAIARTSAETAPMTRSAPAAHER